jgi:hypothetical protein
MSDGNGNGNDGGTPAVEKGEIVAPDQAQGGDGKGRESVEQPAKVMRIGSMIKQLLDEVRQAPLDERSRDRLREVFDTSVKELGEALSDDLRDELARLAPSFEGDETPSDAELRVAQAQLVGWLEGLFHGIQATLFAQQMAARQQLEEMRRLPAGEDPRGATPPGTYL